MMLIKRRVLSDALKQLVRVADPKALITVLSHILIEANGQQATLTATDLDQLLTVQVPAEGEIEACLPCKLLNDLVKCKKSDKSAVLLEQLPDDNIALTVEGMVSKIQGMPVDDFPEAPSAKKADWHLTAIWPSGPLTQALAFVLPAASNDQTRAHLNSVFVSGNCMYTTDGHRLHQAALPASLAEPFLLPASAAKALKYILAASDQVFLARTGDFVRFKVGSFQFDAKLLDEQYPKVENVIPDRASLKTRLVLDPAEFTRALSQLSKLSPDKAVKFTVNGKCTLDAFDPDAGSASLAVPTIQNTHTGADLVVGYNAGFLLDALKKSGDAVELGFSDALSPMRIDREDGLLAVVMPLRI